MYNTTFKLIMLGFLVLLFYNCSDDFLDKRPESSVDEDDFFKDADQFESSVNGAYVSVRELADQYYWVFKEMRSDNTNFEYYDSDRGQEFVERVDYFLTQPSDESVDKIWNGSYDGIGRCNLILDKINSFDSENEEDKDRIHQFEGESEFLRAFHYFNLVFLFGDVPLILKSTDNPDDAFSDGRTDKDSVYKSIKTDLKSAIELLPEKYGDNENGRATSGAARTLLAKLYMMQHKYSRAESVLRDIDNYSLLDNYEKIFDPGNKGNDEIIFAVQYEGSEEGLGSDFMYRFAPTGSGSLVTHDEERSNLARSAGWNTPTQDMIKTYENGDIRKSFSLKLGFEDEDGNFVEQPYVSKYNFGFDESGSTSVNFPIFRYADVILLLAESLNEQGYKANGEAFDLVNKIRSRAGLSDITSEEVTDQKEFRNLLFHERRVELAFENKRWFDLLRMGKEDAVRIMNSHGNRELELRDNIPSSSFDVTIDKLVLPIPQSQIEVDGLEQNPR